MGNNIESIDQVEKLKHNINLEELNLSRNPIAINLEDYREAVIEILPNLKSLDSVPVVKEKILKAPLASKRKEIEDHIENTVLSKVIPKAIQRRFDLPKKPQDYSMRPSMSFESAQTDFDNKNRQETSRFTQLFRGGSNSPKSLGRIGPQDKSLNVSSMTMSKPPAPIVSLDNGRKNDESGLFSFMHAKDLNNPKYEPMTALKEIINIQEAYIKKKSNNISMELIQKWRSKVFELLFENKKNEILFNEKYKRLLQDKQQVTDELDNAMYLKSITDQELKSANFELNSKTEQLEALLSHVKEKEDVHVNVSYKLSEFENMKVQIKSMVEQFNHYMIEEQAKINQAMFDIQSYHKRLVICQNRIKTCIQISRSDKESYIEKYKQIQRDMKNLKDKSIEERDLKIVSMQHQMKIDIENMKKREEDIKNETDKMISESEQKLKDMQSTTDGVKSDNQRLVKRIRELEEESINLKTEIATKNVSRTTELAQARQSYESSLISREEQIRQLKNQNNELIDSDSRNKKIIGDIKQQLEDSKHSYDKNVNDIKEQCDHLIANKNRRILQLEEENKEINEKLFRKTKFESMFSLDQPLNTIEVQKPQVHHMMSQSVDGRSLHDLDQRMTPGRSTPPTLPVNAYITPISGTKDNPVELQPVGMARSNPDFNPMPKANSQNFPISSHSHSHSQKQLPQTHTSIPVKPSNNPFYPGIYNRQNSNIMTYMNLGSSPDLSTPKSLEKDFNSVDIRSQQRSMH